METNVNLTRLISPSLLERVRYRAERNPRLLGAELMVLVEEGLARRESVEQAATESTRL